MEFSQNLGKFLQTKMHQQGLTISELAELATTSRSAMQTYLSGTSNPRLDTIELLCEIWNVKPNVLLCGDMNPSDFPEEGLLRDCSQLPQPAQTYVVQLLQTIEHLVELLAESTSSDAKDYMEEIRSLTTQDQ